MSSIGIIVRAESDVDTLPRDWIPEPLGTRDAVMAVIQLNAPGAVGDLRLSLQALSLNLELEIDAGPLPKSITVSGVWGPKEPLFVGALCKRLGARFYDSEMSEFIKV